MLQAVRKRSSSASSQYQNTNQRRNLKLSFQFQVEKFRQKSTKELLPSTSQDNNMPRNKLTAS